MSKIFILVASLMCISTLAACSGRASPPSDPTSICAPGLRPFGDDCSGARFDENRIQHCLIATNTANEICQGLAETVPCINNPFETACETALGFGRIDSIRQQRVFNCMSLFPGFPAQTTGIPCGFVNSCGDNQNPFGAACLEFDIFDGNRTTRIELCTANQENIISGCRQNRVGGADNQTIHECITANPFHADCTDDAFDEARLRRVVACSVDTPATTLNCSNAIGVDIGSDDGMQTIANCITNPFHIDCQNLAFNTARAERMIACGDAGSSEDCTLATTGATAANWLRSFTTPLDTKPDITNPRNQFLQGSHLLAPTQRVREPVTTANPNPRLPDQRALDIGDALRNSGAAPDVQFLNLAIARYGEPPEGSILKPLLIVDEEGNSAGDASDGVAFFFASAARDANGYAGILAGTDLGTVPPTTTESATWNGEIIALGHFPAKDFKLDIDFSARSVAAFVRATLNDNSTEHFSINGTFDGTTGVISGTVELGNYTDNVNLPANLVENENRGSGMLTGLIGEEGAVGVFIKNPNDTGKSFNFAGGFVAAPAN